MNKCAMIINLSMWNVMDVAIQQANFTLNDIVLHDDLYDHIFPIFEGCLVAIEQ